MEEEHFHLTSAGLNGILSSLGATAVSFILDPLEGTENGKAESVSFNSTIR